MKTSFAGLTMLILACIAFSAFTPGPGTCTVSNDPELSIASIGGAYLVFAGKNGGEITKSELRGETELQVDGCAKGSRIFSYTLEIYSKGKTQKLQAKSNTLTQEMVSALAKLQTGESFAFKAMKAYLPNGEDVVDVHGERFVVV